MTNQEQVSGDAVKDLQAAMWSHLKTPPEIWEADMYAVGSEEHDALTISLCTMDGSPPNNTPVATYILLDRDNADNVRHQIQRWLDANPECGHCADQGCPNCGFYPAAQTGEPS